MENKNRDPIDAYLVLNSIIGDIIASTRCLEIFKLGPFKDISEPVKVTMNRMCFTNLVLVLSKWIEFHSRFYGVISKKFSPAIKVLNKEIASREVILFRNTIAGHILDKKTRNIVPLGKIDEAFWKLVDGDFDKFRLWMNNPQDNNYPITVLSIFEAIRDEIRSEYKFDEDDIFPIPKT